MMILPESPFAEEKERLGRGFLSDNPFVLRRFNVKLGNKNLLSPSERMQIGMTGPETDAEEIAMIYGIALSYVYKLRQRYRQGKRWEKAS